MSDWIAVTDKLPDDDATVMIAMDDGEVWTGYMEYGEWRYVSGEPVAYASITHWMDFPEPPNA